jgi:Cu/Zn superoxide dismutase
VAGATAQLRSPSSAATGVVHVFDTKDGIQVQLFISNLQPGIHRIALHENANCKSPNLFSAGKPWAPPTFTGDAGNLLPGFIANESGNEHGYVAFVKGVSVDGPVSIRNRSVVIHWGNFTSEAMPGQPNNRVACGTFESNKPFL